ncbi:MAG: winged helix-turn-helix transcriptional regulator [Gemmatimonadaceae bacterium]|nr:winged helix-turn-helix transcriptional regulator [Gemmatimonadaceae bacterium]
MDIKLKHDPTATRALDALRRLVHALQAASRVVDRPYGVTGAQLLVLRQVAASPGCALGDVARATLADPSTVSVVVRRLVRARLVRRAADPADARRAVLTLTRRGAAVARSAPPAPQEAVLVAVRALSAGDRRALARILERLVTDAGLAEVRPTMFLEPAPRRGRRGH